MILRRSWHVLHKSPFLARCIHRKPGAAKRRQAERERPIPLNSAQIASAFIPVYRSLLRSAGYFPDTYARDYFRSQIRRLTRQHPHGADWLAMLDQPTPDVLKTRNEYLRKRSGHLIELAKDRATKLRAASDGSLRQLIRLLFMAYGRIGDRQKELLEPLTRRAIGWERDSAKDPILSSLKDLHPTNLHRVPALPPLLRDLLHTQSSVRLPHDVPVSLERVKKLSPDIPESNSWHRPMPQVRIVNIATRKYDALLANALPPLPCDEFEHLEQLVAKEKPTFIPQRRPRGTGDAPPLTPLEIVLSVDRTKPRKRPEMPGTPKADTRTVNILTPRLMRRIYARVLRCSCVMEWSEKADKCVFRFGRIQRSKVSAAPEIQQILGKLLEGSDWPTDAIVGLETNEDVLNGEVWDGQEVARLYHELGSAEAVQNQDDLDLAAGWDDELADVDDRIPLST